MSRASLEKFMEQVADSEELQAKIGDEIEIESLIALGAESGFDFSAEDLQESAELIELSDQELEDVAGGTAMAARPQLSMSAFIAPTINRVRGLRGGGSVWRPSMGAMSSSGGCNDIW
jgi:predicted ribosomally synthesized peptide with nif11-like leader|tara:strand:+ start:1683 stop:2036 length:354 start_codon:yes stop_codon:yes gene_type:complete